MSVLQFRRVAPLQKYKETGGVLYFLPPQPATSCLPLTPETSPTKRLSMSYDNATIIDLLDDLDLDIRGFQDATPEASLLFPLDFSNPEASTSTVCEYVASTGDDDDDDDEFSPTFELLEEIELDPRQWCAAGPPVWDTLPVPLLIVDATEDRLLKGVKGLTIEVPPLSPSRAGSRPLPKENLASPTSPIEGKFARLRDRGSSLALRAFNSTLGSPEIHHRVLI
ncbi:hypothetical protein B0H16DRAFT_958387 [Mycena metata]|uniref:Uncharacterized protein n=1 Tax=Mycena metata TaxID=1033252 RepID=A0AAD7K3J6_9AGAR|nr:hypothetical protein B0H16DRAFT_958387 [Mycena metata]